jgi:hypothetical protein
MNTRTNTRKYTNTNANTSREQEGKKSCDERESVADQEKGKKTAVGKMIDVGGGGGVQGRR